jgi:hypothetical protein
MGNSAAKNQKNLLNKNAGTLGSESQGLLPGIENDWTSIMAPLNPTDVAAIQQEGEGTTAQSYDAAQNAAQTKAAASNNPVGALDLQDTLAQQKGAAVGQQGLQDQATIDAMNLQRKEAGTAGLTGVQQNLQSGSNSLYGNATTAADEQQATGFNWGNFLDSLVSGTARVATMGLAGKGGGGGGGDTSIGG